MPNGYVTPHVKLAALAMVMFFACSTIQAQAQERVIMTFGDSLTAGYGLPASEGYVAQLQTALRQQGVSVRVRNGSVSGDTTSGGRARLDWTLKGKIDLVILELGANDFLRAVNPAVTRRNLDAILGELEKRDIPVLLAGMKAPPNLGPRYGKTFNRIYPDLAERYDVALYPFFLQGVAGRRALNQRDGIHPNAAGVEVIVAAMVPYVLELLFR